MTIGETLYITDREQWRIWLIDHHTNKKDIWLIYYRQDSGLPRIPYSDAVEEALCFGWIDSIVKRLDDQCFVQRFSPRKPKSVLSELNRERIRRMIALGRMTQAGLDAVRHAFDPSVPQASLCISPDILQALRHDAQTWDNFEHFTDSYKRIRMDWIESARVRPAEFEKRLAYFLKMTAKNKTFGMLK